MSLIPPTAKLLIVGDKPGTNTDPLNPLGYDSAQSGRNLALMLGLSKEVYEKQTFRINARSLPRADIGEDAPTYFMTACLQGIPTLLVGREAARVTLGKDSDYVPFGPAPIFSDSCFIMPHTSGRNRFWNDRSQSSQIIQRLLAFIAAYAPALGCSKPLAEPILSVSEGLTSKAGTSA